jgi:hypothetical protein
VDAEHFFVLQFSVDFNRSFQPFPNVYAEWFYTSLLTDGTANPADSREMCSIKASVNRTGFSDLILSSRLLNLHLSHKNLIQTLRFSYFNNGIQQISYWAKHKTK